MFHFINLKKAMAVVAISLVTGLSLGAVQAASPAPTVKPKVSPTPTSMAAANAGPYFFEGKRIILDQNYQGNVFAVGNEVIVTGSVQGNLFVAGGTVKLLGTVKGMVAAAGGIVNLNGRVDGDVFVAGAEVTQTKTAVITGALAMAAKKAEVTGVVQGKTWLGAQTAHLNGQLNRDLKVMGESLTVGPLATVAGQVWGQLQSSPLIQAPANWARQPEFVIKPSEWNRVRPGHMAPIFSVAWIITEAVKIAGSVVVTVAVWFCARRWVETGRTALQSHPWSALGRGVAVVCAAPLLLILIAITGVGVGLAILLAALYLVLLIVSGTIPAFVIGGYLVPKSTGWVQVAVGTAIIGLIVAVPFIGWLVKLAVVLFGAGAWTYAVHEKA
jgi:cytoskeletal protein CcmA (bactofilin family)